MQVITKTSELSQFAQSAAQFDFICLDTEFMREHTFYSQLCLIQLARPEPDAIDHPRTKEHDLAPFIDLLMNPKLTKVMHAARQDMEIFYQICDTVPPNIFDTQIAAMALGFGDSAGYGALVKGRLGIDLDKGARFTDWSRRPLSQKQLNYALADVTHLRDLYPDMVTELKERGRLEWVHEEMLPQSDPKLYQFNPEEAWQRLKIRNPKQKYLATLRAAAAWREREAIRRNIPRRRVLKDDTLYDLAQQRPADAAALGRLRSVPQGFEKSKYAQDLLQTLTAAIANAEDYAPQLPRLRHMPPNLGPSVDMLKTLLRLRTEYEDLAPRLIANAADIEQIAAFGDEADVAALKGWRRKIFGDDALLMLEGKIVLRLDGRIVIAERVNTPAEL